MEIYDRFDIIVKLAYAKALLYRNNVSFWQRVYFEHIEIMTSSTYREADGIKKGLNAYDEAFKSILFAMDSGNFNYDEPLNANRYSQISDGAHRLSCAIATHTTDSLKYKEEEHNVRYGLELFYEYDFKFAGIVLEDFLLTNPDLRLAIIWPSNPNAESIFQKLQGKMIDYRLELNEIGKINLVRVAYSNEQWLGSIENKYSGAAIKAAECFRQKGPARLVIFKSNKQDLNDLKGRLRKIGGVDKHSIHITDTHDETVEKSLDLLGSNPNDWINNRLIYRDNEFCDRLRQVQSFVNLTQVSPKWYKLVGSTLLEYYDIVKSDDLDVATAMTITDLSINQARKRKIEFREASIEYVAMNRAYVCGVPLHNLRQLMIEYERAIGDDKKQYYLKLINHSSSYDKSFESRLARRRLRNRITRMILNFLFDIGLYHFVRKVYRGIAKR